MIEENMFNLDRRIIIFEGLDRCGKSTQTKLLSNKLEQFNLKPIILHYGKPLFGTLEYQFTYYTQEFYQYYLMTKNDKKTVLILDRSFLGEFVWSHFREYEGEEIIQDLYQTQIFDQIKDNIAYFNFYDSWERFNKRNDGDSLFKNKEEFNITKRKFKDSFVYLNKLGYHPPITNINLESFDENVSKSVQNIHKTVMKNIR